MSAALTAFFFAPGSLARGGTDAGVGGAIEPGCAGGVDEALVGGADEVLAVAGAGTTGAFSLSLAPFLLGLLAMTRTAR
jgi:hypothetical protein